MASVKDWYYALVFHFSDPRNETSDFITDVEMLLKFYISDCRMTQELGPEEPLNGEILRERLKRTFNGPNELIMGSRALDLI